MERGMTSHTFTASRRNTIDRIAAEIEPHFLIFFVK